MGFGRAVAGRVPGNMWNNQISPAGTTPGVPKPSWQSGAGLNIPQDGVRDVPDISLTSAGHDPYCCAWKDLVFRTVRDLILRVFHRRDFGCGAFNGGDHGAV